MVVSVFPGRFLKPLFAGSILAIGTRDFDGLPEPLVPLVINGDLMREGPPAHRVQFVRSFTDTVVEAIEAGDAEGAGWRSGCWSASWG